MSSRSLKVNLSEQASKDLKEVARTLSLSEAEVLRKGLLIMGLYAKIREQDGALLIRDQQGAEQRLVLG